MLRRKSLGLQGFAVLCAALGLVACSEGSSLDGNPGSGPGNGGAPSGGHGGDAPGSGGHGGTTGNGGAGGEGAGGPLINVGYIGGPCEKNADCDYDGGFCLTEDLGFPGGMCSLDCDLYCPDADGFVTTFCVEADDLGVSGEPGLCTTQCDFGLSPSGCRDGYHCELSPRHDEPQTEKLACVPGEGDPVALTDCQKKLAARGVSFWPTIDPMDHPDGMPGVTCTIEDPVYVMPVMRGVTFHPSWFDSDPAMTLASCPLALALDDAAKVLADLGVTDVAQWGIYNCRPIAGTETLSQHGHANAIDLRAFKTLEGDLYSVIDDYEVGEPDPFTAGGILLREIAETLFAEGVFNIILTPDYNEAHHDHFHCDLTPGSHFFE